MTKLTLSSVLSSYSSASQLNRNFSAISTGFENTVSRDGTSPNHMLANFDMNGYFILNLPEPTLNSHAATKQYVDTLAGALDAATVDSDATAYTVLPTGGSTALTLAAWLSGTIDARAYGVIADATDLAANTLALQAAVTAAAGKRLILPKGNINITAATGAAAITLPATGIEIMGQGRANTTIVLDDTYGHCAFQGADGANYEFHHFGIDGGVTSAAIDWQRGISLRGCLGINIHDMNFTNLTQPLSVGTEGYHGTDTTTDGTRQTERYTVQNCYFKSCWGTIAVVTKYNGAKSVHILNNIFEDACSIAISVESEDNLTAYNYWGADVIISGNLIDGCSYVYTSGASNVAYGITVTEQCRRVLITDNIIVDTLGSTVAAGIAIGTSPTQDDEEVRELNISNNIITNTTAASGRGHNIWLAVGDTSIDTIVISGNILKNGEVGINFETASSTKTLGDISKVIMANNMIDGPTEFGIWCQSVSSSGELPVRQFVMIGNHVTGCVSSAIAVYALDSIFASNVVRGNGGAGITFSAGSKRNQVLGNMVSYNGGIGVTGDLQDTLLSDNIIFNNGQTSTNGYGVYGTAGNKIKLRDNKIGDTGDAGLAIGSTTSSVSNLAFKYYIAGTEYSLGANAVGTAPGNDVVPITKYGAVAFEVGTNGTVDAIEATDNATGYNTAALAVAGLPAVQADHVRFGWVTVTKSDGAFTFGSTAFNAANVTTAYTSAVTDYCVRFANNGQEIMDNDLTGWGLATIFGGIASHNTSTYDAGNNRTV